MKTNKYRPFTFSSIQIPFTLFNFANISSSRYHVFHPCLRQNHSKQLNLHVYFSRFFQRQILKELITAHEANGDDAELEKAQKMLQELGGGVGEEDSEMSTQDDEEHTQGLDDSDVDIDVSNKFIAFDII